MANIIILIFLFLNSCIITPPLLAAEKPKTIKIASGKIDGLYYRTATYICKIVEEKYKTKCEVVLTNGSYENYLLLKSSKVDLAIIQENFLNNDTMNFLGELYKEGVFILYNSKTDINDIRQFNNMYTSFDNGSGNERTTYQYIKKVNTKDTAPSDGIKDLCNKKIDYKVFTIGLDKNIIKNYVGSCNLKIFSFDFDKCANFFEVNKILLEEKKICIPIVKAILVSGKGVGENFRFIFENNNILSFLEYVKVSRLRSKELMVIN